MRTYPKTRLRDLVQLVAILVSTRAGRGDLAEAATAWLRGLTERYDSPNLVIDLLVRRILFVSGPDLSAHVLDSAPASDAFVAGTAKRKAMTFIAPHALTISQDAEWRVLRAYNEDVLDAQRPHSYQQAFLAHVQKAFEQSVASIQDLRGRMGRVMLASVFGEGNAPDHLIGDIQELFAEVGLRTALIGSRKTAKRDQFHKDLRRLWEKAGAEKSTLLGSAHDAAATVDERYRRVDVLVEQIPHWMFTFTNSGADLLARSLSMIAARPESLSRVLMEIETAGALNDAASFRNLPYLEACILEAGRLYPPVALTSHRAARRHVFDGVEIPAGTELLQFFPFNNRDKSRDPLASHFRPERWLDPGDSVHGLHPNSFLSGARACPGRNLILFIDKAAIATVLRGSATRPTSNRLSRDPLPFSFPEECLWFGPGRSSSPS